MKRQVHGQIALGFWTRAELRTVLYQHTSMHEWWEEHISFLVLKISKLCIAFPKLLLPMISQLLLPDLLLPELRTNKLCTVFLQHHAATVSHWSQGPR